MTLGTTRMVALSALSLAAALAATLGAHAAASKPVLSGAAAIHDLAKYGSRYCFADHVHYGSSSGQASQAKAKAEAIESWYELVNLEYGAQWSSFAVAAKKDLKCSASGTSWGCEVHAIPCSR